MMNQNTTLHEKEASPTKIHQQEQFCRCKCICTYRKLLPSVYIVTTIEISVGRIRTYNEGSTVGEHVIHRHTVVASNLSRFILAPIPTNNSCHYKYNFCRHMWPKKVLRMPEI